MTVSRSTVNNDIKKAKQTLEKYNGMIKGIPNRGIKIVCDNFNTHLILIHIIYDVMQAAYFLNIEVQKSIKEAACYYKLDIVKSQLLYKTVVILLERKKENVILSNPIPMYKNFESKSSVFYKLIETIESNYAITLSEIDIDFLSFPINTSNSAHIIGDENNYNEKKLKLIVQQMLVLVRKDFMIDIDEYIFFNKVKYHLLFLINRLTFHLPNTEIASKQVRTRFPLAYELAKISLGVLDEKYHLKATKTDISYLAIYYALALNEKETLGSLTTSKKNNIALITNSGKGGVELLKQQLKEILGPEIEIEIFTTNEMDINYLSSFNIIFTTEYFVSTIDIPIIKIDKIIDPNDLNKKIKHIKPNNIFDNQNMDQDINFFIFKLREDKNYFSNVDIMTKKIFNEKHAQKINKKFLEKENTNTMVYDNGVNFPHIIDEDAEKITISLCYTETFNKKINLIFFLIVPNHLNERQENILTKLYNKIFSTISNIEIVTKFQSIESTDEFITLLFEE